LIENPLSRLVRSVVLLLLMAPKDANARETMLAVVSNAYGSPDVLEYKQLPKPTPLDGEVLLQVHAAGIHAPARL